MPSPPPMVHQVSKCTVKPPAEPPSPAGRLHLTTWDLAMLSAHYIRKGLLFSHPPSDHFAARLKSSLSAALHHFYPLAGRLATDKVLDAAGSVSGIHVSIDCNSQGVEFIHAAPTGITVADVLGHPGDDVPSFIQSFFPLDGAVNHDGHDAPLLVVQLTELADGAFVACCFNHVVGDGTAYWHFFNAWAEMARSKGGDGVLALSRPPVHDRWIIDGESPPITLPFSHPDEFIDRFTPPEPLRERFFHFSARSIARLKARANEEAGTADISSFQALSSLVWRSITRARHLPNDRQTSCHLAIQNRGRLRPPLSPDYFGNSIYTVSATAEASEVAERGLEWAARLVHESVAGHTDAAIRGMVRAYHAKPVVYRLTMFDGVSVMMGSSPRFDMYGCDFGWGKAVAVRSGMANKFDGKVTSYPGREGGGSVDLEVCLAREGMAALELDEEFMGAVGEE